MPLQLPPTSIIPLMASWGVKLKHRSNSSRLDNQIELQDLPIAEGHWYRYQATKVKNPLN